MKQQRITGVHFDVYSLLSIEMLNSVKSVIDIIPFWKSVFLNAKLMGTGYDRQTAALSVRGSNRCPYANNFVRRPKLEVPQILVHRMPSINFGRLVKHITGQTVNSLP